MELSHCRLGRPTMALGLTCMALMLLICMLATPIAATPTRHHAARPLALSNIDVRADNPQVGGSGITQQESLEGKGDELIRLMNSPQDQVPQSQWTRWEEAQDWGWRTYMYSENNLKAKLEQLETDMPMFPQFGWSNQPSHWEGITAAHIRESKHANMTYPTTQAQCSCLIGTRDGVLIVLARTSPAKSVEESELDVRPDRMPLLCYSSDMLYLLWDSVVDGSQKIKHVLIHNIINKDTKGVMLQALRKQPPEVSQVTSLLLQIV